MHPDEAMLDDAELARRYRNGGTIQGLADELGIGRYFVRRRLVASGEKIRTRGGIPVAVPVADIVTRYENGESIRTLATSLHVAYGTVHNVLRNAGITFRPQGGNNNPRGRPKT